MPSFGQLLVPNLRVREKFCCFCKELRSVLQKLMVFEAMKRWGDEMLSNVAPLQSAYLVAQIRNHLPIWGCAEIGVSPNHPNFNGIFPYNLTIWGIPHLWKSPYSLLESRLHPDHQGIFCRNPTPALACSTVTSHTPR